MSKHIVVLGAGFGGLELVTRLSESVPDQAHITLIDKNDSFMFRFELAGDRSPVDQPH